MPLEYNPPVLLPERAQFIPDDSEQFVINPPILIAKPTFPPVARNRTRSKTQPNIAYFDESTYAGEGIKQVNQRVPTYISNQSSTNKSAARKPPQILSDQEKKRRRDEYSAETFRKLKEKAERSHQAL